MLQSLQAGVVYGCRPGRLTTGCSIQLYDCMTTKSEIERGKSRGPLKSVA